MVMVRDDFQCDNALAAAKTVPDLVKLYVECRRALFHEGGPRSVMVGGMLILLV